MSRLHEGETNNHLIKFNSRLLLVLKETADLLTIAANLDNPAQAVEALQAAAPYELGGLGAGGFGVALYAVYVRGQAYLASNQGTEAATEFPKILDHPWIVGNGIIGALAHLGIGRAYALRGESAKARAAYQDFFTLWKDADPDIPILLAAKAEYAKLQ